MSEVIFLSSCIILYFKYKVGKKVQAHLNYMFVYFENLTSALNLNRIYVEFDIQRTVHRDMFL